MNILRHARTVLLSVMLAWAGVACAQIAVPPIQNRVTDQTATLTTDQKAALEQKLRDFENKKGSQIAVLIVPTTAPETIEQYALRVAEQWKLGRKKVDDGAILLIAKNDRSLRIEVGYGLEGVLNDATSKRIISDTITPYFKQGDFNAGIQAGADQMIRVVDGEPLPAKTSRLTSRTSDADGFQQYAPILFIMALVVGGVLRALFGRLPGAIVTGGVVGGVAWLVAGAISIAMIAGVLALFFTLLSGSLGARGIGAYYGGSGRGGGGFSGGGSGFSGGGGGFGGGGASGRW
ncbi:YgcG family protein [Undibacterium sp. CY18W]|uniref:YgcG family protein n=1 Tax=Undibacterium hunanense TaxID=2762292 RepID=A0ABR6ZZ32_9BURK|nr:YgcG family protein [Undibacterium hunanense]MBC3921009.1 YgcG family protein [Undibacterium hunanense]